MLKLENLDLLMPELVEEYGSEKDLNIFLNPHDESEDVKKLLESNNQIVFKKEATEVMLAFSFELRVRNDEDPNQWDLLRTGFLTFKANIQVK